MPIYEYECGACGERQEFIQKFSDPQKRKCPACGALKLKRLVSAAAFHLKGSGWYVTDFRDKDKKKGDGQAGSKADSKGDGKAAAKSDGAKSKDTGTKSSDSGKSKKSGDTKSAG
jgi:putative FmdB family regulatory protein